MEHEHRSVLTLFANQPFSAGASVHLGDDAAHHARVRRVRPGDAIRLLDGAGGMASGLVASITKRTVEVRLDDVKRRPRPTALEVIVPVADRDRMLIAAEKCVELQITAWHPVFFSRSKSVATRGEGEKFHDKVWARMRSALEQSGGAWLPRIHEESDAEAALQTIGASQRRFILDAGGASFHGQPLADETAVAVGPEGGFESAELERAVSLGWTPVSLGSTTLRFETAIIAAVAVIRAAQYSQGRSNGE